jgi:hypothetical protein
LEDCFVAPENDEFNMNDVHNKENEQIKENMATKVKGRERLYHYNYNSYDRIELTNQRL